jgi:hypothetical protein
MNEMTDLKDIKIKELLNAMVLNSSTENPVDYFDRIYESINPIMMLNALQEAKDLINNENAVNSKLKKPKENAEVFITLGGESMTQNLYTGIIAALLWLPKYLRDAASKYDIDEHSLDICLSVLNKCALPKIHDIKEEVIKGEKVEIKPSNVRHYTAFLAAIVSWLNDGVNMFKVNGIMKTNLELVRYLSAAAIGSFPAVPFGCYHVGTCKTTDITKLTENLGKSFDWLKYMTDESYIINEPKFVVTTDNAPVVSIVGHPLTETFAVKTEDGISKWLGIFVETEEFNKMCAQAGFTTDQLKKYIITTSPAEHETRLKQHDPIAVFINKQKMTNEIFKLRHKFSSVKLDEDDEYSP